MSFDAAFQRTVGTEGGYSNNPNDAGGATMFGITEVVARAHGWGGRMIDLPLDRAKEIYRLDYWTPMGLDQVGPISPAIAAEVFDTGVNCGISIPVPFLQRALNVFNRQAKDYPDMPVDGHLGPTTAAALASFLKVRGPDGEKVILAALRAQRGIRYLDLIEKNPKLEAFAYGWFLNRVAA